MRLTSYSVSDMKRYISCAHIIIHWILRCQSLFKIKKKFYFLNKNDGFPLYKQTIYLYFIKITCKITFHIYNEITGETFHDL